MENCSDSFDFFSIAVILWAAGDSNRSILGDDDVSIDLVAELTRQGSEARLTGSDDIHSLRIGRLKGWYRVRGQS